MKLTFGTNLIAVALVSTISVCLSGCGETRSDVGTVTGTVTLNDEPLANAQIEFAPKSGAGTSSFGKTDDSGYYTMMASRSSAGSALGDNTVTITTADIIEQDGEEVVVPEKLPAKYNTSSELSADVQPGGNTFDFKLDNTGADVAQPVLTDE